VITILAGAVCGGGGPALAVADNVHVCELIGGRLIAGDTVIVHD